MHNESKLLRLREDGGAPLNTGFSAKRKCGISKILHKIVFESIIDIQICISARREYCSFFHLNNFHTDIFLSNSIEEKNQRTEKFTDIIAGCRP